VSNCLFDQFPNCRSFRNCQYRQKEITVETEIERGTEKIVIRETRKYYKGMGTGQLAVRVNRRIWTCWQLSSMNLAQRVKTNAGVKRDSWWWMTKMMTMKRTMTSNNNLLPDNEGRMHPMTVLCSRLNLPNLCRRRAYQQLCLKVVSDLDPD
jgi:hypothetical protein